jgi:hypothetical protein
LDILRGQLYRELYRELVWNLLRRASRQSSQHQHDATEQVNPWLSPFRIQFPLAHAQVEVSGGFHRGSLRRLQKPEAISFPSPPIAFGQVQKQTRGGFIDLPIKSARQFRSGRQSVEPTQKLIPTTQSKGS